MPRKSRTQKRKMGGMGSASTYGQYVWGSGAQQHAVSPDSNIIAPANNPLGYRGGSYKMGGSGIANSEPTTVNNPGYIGGDLTAIGVPAVLMAANHLYKRKKAMRGGGEMGTINTSNLLKNATEIMDMTKPTTMPANVESSNNNPPVFQRGTQIFGGNKQVGGKKSKMGTKMIWEKKRVGAGILTDMAVPAVMIAANHLYKRKSRKNKSRSRKIRSRKYRV